MSTIPSRSTFSIMDLTPEQLEVIPKIEKMLNLANRAGTPEEAAAAMGKAQEFMMAYNLDQARIEANSGDSGKRSDEKLKGGHHEFQRELWREVAKLNFCIYMSMVEHEKVWGFVKLPNNAGFRKVAKKTKKIRTHRMIGRTLNVRSASQQAEYIEQSIERITRDNIVEHGHHPWGEFAMSYRQGMVDNIVERIRERHKHLLTEAANKAAEQEEARRASGLADVSTNMSLVITNYADAEHEANLDHLDPDRHTRALERAERIRKEEQEQAERRARIQQRYAEWAAAHPEEAAAEEAQRRERRAAEEKIERQRAKRREYYYNNHPGYTRSYGSYQEKGNRTAQALGYEAGSKVSLDRQAGQQKPAGYL